MSLYGMMRTSASGMNAQANMLGTVADNIANASTTGYKRSTEEFSTLVLESGVADYESGAVESHTRTFVSQQGAFNYTTSETDIAIRGEGFFVVSSPDGSMALTRAGSFVKDSDGVLVNAAGYQLMGYPSAQGTNPVANGLAGLMPVDIATLGMIAQPSTRGFLYVNLPPSSTAVPAADLPSTNAASSAYTRMTSVVAYDNVGAAVTLDIYETKTAANTWEFAVFDRAEAASGGGFPYTSGPLATTTLTFDPSNGALASGSPTSISIAVPNGASLELDLSQTAELAADFMVRDLGVNGSAPSAVERIDISDSGEVIAIYKNGSRAVTYQIPLAKVASPDNLESVTGNVFKLTADSGGIVVGLPTADGLGEIVSSALEKSTVDVATELTTMIEAQHSYTANSKVFQTAADLMEVLINLKR